MGYAEELEISREIAEMMIELAEREKREEKRARIKRIMMTSSALLLLALNFGALLFIAFQIDL